jgi:hypothetical protein
MSDENKFIDPIHAQIEEGALDERKRKEVLKKELVVRERKVDTTLQMYEEADRNSAIEKGIDYGLMSPEAVAKVIQDNTDYILASRKKMRFINKVFDKMVPFFRKNLILVGARTGGGKSTTVANIAIEMLRNKDPETLEPLTILIISNEESTEDVYNRITCLLKGWHYVNHDEFTDEQLAFFNRSVQYLSKFITVVDNNFGGSSGTTSSIEGISNIFDNQIEAGKKTGKWYSAVIIDYFQKICFSRANPMLDQYKVQSMFAKKLDDYKNLYPAPIVLLAQVRPAGEENPLDFKLRIEGSKEISNVATCAIEMEPCPQELYSEWTIHKSRFNEKLGDSIKTGYEKGRYVEHTDVFKAMVAARNAAKEREAMDKTLGMPDVVGKVEGEGNGEV